MFSTKDNFFSINYIYFVVCKCFQFGPIFGLVKGLYQCYFTKDQSSFIFVEPVCGEQDIVVTPAVRCMCMCLCVHLSVGPSKFVQTITSTIMDGFQFDTSVVHHK